MPFYAPQGTTATIIDAWGMWVSNSTTTATTITNCRIWNTWTSQTATSGVYIQPADRPQREPTPAELEARRIETNRSVKLYHRARRKARALLLSALTRDQRHDFLYKGRIDVRARASGRRYRISLRGGISGNIAALREDGSIDHWLCAHPHVSVPFEDQILTQKLMIEHHEDEFLRVANVH